MNAIALGALYTWPFVILLIFLAFPPRRAVVASMIFGWLFLPVGSIEISGFPEYSKVTATSIGVLVATVLTNFHQLITIRWRTWDLPMLSWCLVPLASSLSNGLGAWDGFSGVASNVFQWGIPYVIGRVYFRSWNELRDLAMGIFLGGLVYAPLCLWEIRMSPNLHFYLYGFHPDQFIKNVRFGGYRPNVFLRTGLATSLWMVAAALCGLVFAINRRKKAFIGLPIWIPAFGLLFVTLLTKSLGALVLLAVSYATFLTCRLIRVKILLYLMMLSPFAYVALRVPGIWSGEPITSLAEMIDADRAASFQFRIDNENILAAKALEKPVFGWGGWGRSRVYNDMGQDITVTDGFWIIAFGQHGFVGLLSSMGLQIVPALLALHRIPATRLGVGKYWPAVGLTCVLFIYAADNLLNAMPNPVFVMAAGALTSWALSDGKNKKNRNTHRRYRSS